MFGHLIHPARYSFVSSVDMVKGHLKSSEAWEELDDAIFEDMWSELVAVVRKHLV